MKRFFIFYFTIFVASFNILLAQKISVASFRLEENDLTANTAGSIVYDQNDEKCALIKVSTTLTGFTFDVGILGVTKTEQHTAEIWVYVPAGIKRISIAHQQLGHLENYDLGQILQKGRTYRLELITGSITTVISADDGKRYFSLDVNPHNAVVLLDEELKSLNEDGQAIVLLDPGKHNLKITAAGYDDWEETISIEGSDIQKGIKLVSAFASLTINTETPDAEIFINGQIKGKNSWTGELLPGTYRIEVSKSGYFNHTETIDLGKKEFKNIMVSSLKEKYGILDIRYLPIGTEIWIDNKLVGSSPSKLDNVLEGTHQVQLKKAGYETISKDIDIEFSKLTLLDGNLLKLDDEEDLMRRATDALKAKDYVTAKKFYEQAAKLGNAHAYCILGCFYELGQGCNVDVQKAREYYEKAANLGNHTAQKRLGVLYFHGNGGPKDREKAAEWFTKAAKQGDAKAMLNLGWMYQYGWGVTQDEDFGRSLIKKALEDKENPIQIKEYYDEGLKEMQNKYFPF